jgi:hypothetical protein
MKYLYLGKTKANLLNYGIVYPKQQIEVDFVINNPLFRLLKIKKRK